MPTDVSPRASHVLMQVFGLCVLGATMGLLVNQLRDHGLPLRTPPFDYNMECQEKMGDAHGNTVTVEELAALAGNKGVALVDIRSADLFAAGHIPGARNIAVSVVAATPAALLKPLVGSTRVIVYDENAELGRAEEFAGELQAAKVDNVVFLAQGYAGWTAAGKDVTTGAQP